MRPWIGKLIDVLAKVELCVSLLALGFALAMLRWKPLGGVTLVLLVALALLVAASGALFAWDAWMLRRDLKAKDGGKLEVRSGQVRNVARVKPNAPCPCGSGKKLKKCCRDPVEARRKGGVQLGNGMRLVGSELRKVS